MVSQGKIKREEYEEKFLENLGKMKDRDKIILKRSVGNSITDSNRVMLTFFELLKGMYLYPNEEEIYFIISTVYGWNSYSFNGDFGKSIALLNRKKDESTIIKNRFLDLVDCSIDNTIFPRYLQKLVRLAEKESIGIDWLQLLKDLKYWSHEEKFIQKKWIKSFLS